MSESASAAVPRTPPPSRALAGRTASGFVLFIVQVVVVKAVSLVGQVIVTNLLGRQDFGFVGTTFGISAFPQLVQRAGTRELLIQRSARHDRWANAAFWMSLALGVVALIMHLVIAPIAGHWLHEPRVTGLLLVMGIVCLSQSFSVVPEARLYSCLRFRALAVIGTSLGLVQTICLVLFAASGFGAYSYVLPLLVIGVARAVIMWAATGMRIRWTPQFRLWRYMAGRNVELLLVGLAVITTQNADYLALTSFQDAAVLGAYFWAFNMSLQAYQLLAFNLSKVLLPSLSLMANEPVRMRDAFLRASRTLMLAGAPACLLQAVLAGPLIHIFIKPEFWVVIPLLQVLCVGMACQIASQPTLSMYVASGRTRRSAQISLTTAAIFVLIVFAAAWSTTGLAAAMRVAIGVAIFHWVTGPIVLYISIKPCGGHWRNVAGVYVPSLLASGAAAAAAWGAQRLVSTQAPHYYLQVIVATMVFTVVYAAGAWTMAPTACRDALARVAGLLPTRRTRRVD